MRPRVVKAGTVGLVLGSCLVFAQMQLEQWPTTPISGTIEDCGKGAGAADSICQYIGFGMITWEGATDDDFETHLTAVDPTTPDKTVSIPNETGTLAINTTSGLLVIDSGARPACDAAHRGRLWFNEGVTGGGATADTFEVCGKSAVDAYAWYALATIP